MFGRSSVNDLFERDMKSYFKSFLYEKFGGQLWWKILIGVGRVPYSVVGIVNKIISDKNLSIGFKAITFGTYGAFGKSTHKLIAAATANSPQPLFSPWVRPGPKAHAYLLFGFTLARANARMLINAEAKRSSARNSVRTSRPQRTPAVAVHG